MHLLLSLFLAQSTVFDAHPDQDFAQISRDALNTLITVEDAYWSDRPAEAMAALTGFWQKHPPSGPAWNQTGSPTPEVFIGSPSCYYALRMWTDIVEWKIASLDQPRVAAKPLHWTIVLVGIGEGREPATQIQLERGEGEIVERKLDKRLLKDKHRIIKQSTRLFREYVKAISGGRVEVKLEILSRPALRVPLDTPKAGPGERRFAGLAAKAFGKIWKEVPDKVLQKTDWWWVLYPSHVPEQHQDFRQAEFVTGGMGAGPDGASPCFVIDDRWLLRKPPHLGVGDWHEEERRAYLPQWLQHEFFHYLFRIYPDFELEKSAHQWFDLAKWPEDFVGHFEGDYYHQALHKRLTSAELPLHIGMRHAPPPAKLFRNLTTDDLIGYYKHSPAENGWHVGTISRSGSIEKGKDLLVWRNSAGRKWLLRDDLKRGYLRTADDNPYYESFDSPARDFRVVLRRDANGNYLPEVAGFQFADAFYALSKP
jgi:hypothetical protein